MTFRRAVPGLVMSAILAACGSAPGASPSSGSAAVDAEAVAIGTAMAQMRGHLRVATELDAAGDDEGAAVHTSHPAAELLDVVRPDLEEAGAGCRRAGDRPAGGERRRRRAMAPADAIDAAFEEVATAEAAAAGDLADDPAYVGSVIASLLTTVGHEYEEAVIDGELSSWPSSRTPMASPSRRAPSTRTIAADVEAAATEEAAEIEEAFDVLEAALCRVRRRPRPSPRGGRRSGGRADRPRAGGNRRRPAGDRVRSRRRSPRRSTGSSTRSWTCGSG